MNSSASNAAQKALELWTVSQNTRIGQVITFVASNASDNPEATLTNFVHVLGATKKS